MTHVTFILFSKGLPLLDVAQTNIAMYFNEVSDFIDEARNSGGKTKFNHVTKTHVRNTCHDRT